MIKQNLGEEKYWLALARAPRLEPINFIRLLNHFGSPRRLFEAGQRQWRTLNIKANWLNYLQNPNWYAVENDMLWLAQPGNHLLTLDNPNYPPLLREIYDPPPVLFVQGDCAILKSPQLAIVGTHQASREGCETALELARCLSNRGLTITNGLELGIEAASHWGALAGSSKTIAVAVRGLDQIYPLQHYDLAHKIAQVGAHVSEFPPGTPVKREHFSLRSRIISGLSLGTLIIEAPAHSRVFSMVNCAIEQGREVFAVPGSIHNPLVKGSHQLIKEGAKLVESSQDILEELYSYRHYSCP